VEIPVVLPWDPVPTRLAVVQTPCEAA